MQQDQGRANRINGCKGSLVKSRKKTTRCSAQRPKATARTPQEKISVAIAVIRARFRKYAIGFGGLGSGTPGWE